MKHIRLTALSGALTCLMATCGMVTAQTPAAKSPAPAKPATPAAKPSLLNPAAWTAPAPAEFDVKFTTTEGVIVFHITKAWAPHGADRFYNLVRAGFFTDVAFYRVIADFMAQFGVSSDPAVTRAWMQADIKDDKVVESNKRGKLTFAQTGAPNSRGTQLFINFKDNSRLDAMGFAPIGEVTEGMDVVDKLYSGYGDTAEQGAGGPSSRKLDNEGKPYLDRYFPKISRILSAKIVTAPAAAPAKPAAAK
jgi:peptidyl-prolyl cis-trans isomerase A (cyclophilin A)